MNEMRLLSSLLGLVKWSSVHGVERDTQLVLHPPFDDNSAEPKEQWMIKLDSHLGL